MRRRARDRVVGLELGVGSEVVLLREWDEEAVSVESRGADESCYGSPTQPRRVLLRLTVPALPR